MRSCQHVLTSSCPIVGFHFASTGRGVQFHLTLRRGVCYTKIWVKRTNLGCKQDPIWKGDEQCVQEVPNLTKCRPLSITSPKWRSQEGAKDSTLVWEFIEKALSPAKSVEAKTYSPAPFFSTSLSPHSWPLCLYYIAVVGHFYDLNGNPVGGPKHFKPSNLSTLIGTWSA